jgi:hypothetical protein
VVQADVLVLVQAVQSGHLVVIQLKVKYLAVGDDALLGVRLGQRDESIKSACACTAVPDAIGIRVRSGNDHTAEAAGSRAKRRKSYERAGSTHPRCRLHLMSTCAQLLPVSSAILVNVGSEALVPCTNGE